MTEVVVTIDTKTGIIDTIVEATAGRKIQAALSDPARRVNVEYFRPVQGVPLQAHKYVRGLMNEAITGAKGQFALEVPAGALDVTVVHQGHATKTMRGIESDQGMIWCRNATCCI